MRTFRNILAVLLILAGSIWFLQGVNIFTGSEMTGQIQWAIYGAAEVLVGIILLVVTNQHKNDPRS